LVILQAASIDALSQAELEADIASAVAALADIEARYRRDREGILRWVGPDVAKARLLARLEASRVRDREDLVHWLADARRQASQPLAAGRIPAETIPAEMASA
jgi:hypothetical protein